METDDGWAPWIPLSNKGHPKELPDVDEPIEHRSALLRMPLQDGAPEEGDGGVGSGALAPLVLSDQGEARSQALEPLAVANDDVELALAA